MSFRVVGIGEVLWDLLPSGPQLGGAPANFAYHTRQLGAEVQVITRVGSDAYGRKRTKQQMARRSVHSNARSIRRMSCSRN